MQSNNVRSNAVLRQSHDSIGEIPLARPDIKTQSTRDDRAGSYNYPARFRRLVEELSVANKNNKRSYSESFGVDNSHIDQEVDYDSERYGQVITANFFATNQGHGAFR